MAKIRTMQEPSNVDLLAEKIAVGPKLELRVWFSAVIPNTNHVFGSTSWAFRFTQPQLTTILAKHR